MEKSNNKPEKTDPDSTFQKYSVMCVKVLICKLTHHV